MILGTDRRAVDATGRGAAVEELDVRSAELMERAGTAVADEVAATCPCGRVAVVAGPGQQRRRRLGRRAGAHSSAAGTCACSPAGARGARRASPRGGRDARADRRRRGRLAAPAARRGACARRVVIDALLGIGERPSALRTIASDWSDARASARRSSRSTCPRRRLRQWVGSDDRRVAADCHRDVLRPRSSASSYSPAAAHAGDVLVADIGMPAIFSADVGRRGDWTAREYAALSAAAGARRSQERARSRAVVAGSGPIPGAAVLARAGAMRMGAGYVTLAVPEPVVADRAGDISSAARRRPAGEPRARSLRRRRTWSLDLAADYDAVVLGPGLTLAHGRVLAARELVARARTAARDRRRRAERAGRRGRSSLERVRHPPSSRRTPASSRACSA